MSSTPDPLIRFFTLFKDHWDAGTGRLADNDRRYAGWTPKEFANAMSKHGVAISDNTARLWYRGADLKKNLPRATQKTAIFKVFFPDCHANAEMEEAWQAASTRPAAARTNTPATEIDPRAEWKILTRTGVASLVALSVHPPTATNERDVWKLPTTLDIAALEAEHEDKPVGIGLRRAEVTISSTTYQPAEGSLIAKRLPDAAHLQSIPDGVRILGPLVDGVIEGDPFGDTHLCVIEPTGAPVFDEPAPGEPAQVTVQLTAGKRDFHVWDPDLPATRTAAPGANSLSPNRDAVLNALIRDGRDKDDRGHTILARARIRRRWAE